MCIFTEPITLHNIEQASFQIKYQLDEAITGQLVIYGIELDMIAHQNTLIIPVYHLDKQIPLILLDMSPVRDFFYIMRKIYDSKTPTTTDYHGEFHSNPSVQILSSDVFLSVSDFDRLQLSPPVKKIIDSYSSDFSFVVHNFKSEPRKRSTLYIAFISPVITKRIHVSLITAYQSIAPQIRMPPSMPRQFISQSPAISNIHSKSRDLYLVFTKNEDVEHKIEQKRMSKRIMNVDYHTSIVDLLSREEKNKCLSPYQADKLSNLLKLIEKKIILDRSSFLLKHNLNTNLPGKNIFFEYDYDNENMATRFKLKLF